jgi:heme-degrading monooxygenase HmoA
MAERMDALSREQPGFVSIESVRSADGRGITVCCWETLESLKEWKKTSSTAKPKRLAEKSGMIHITFVFARSKRNMVFNKEEKRYGHYRK